MLNSNAMRRPGPHKKLARLFGYELIRRDRHPTFEAHLELTLARLKIDFVIDVGANEGQYGSLLRRAGFEGEIVSFEPNPPVFELLLNKTQSDSKWTAFNFALGAEPGTSTLHLTEHTQLTSFYRPNEYAHAMLGERYNVTNEQEVEVRTLDSHFSDEANALERRRTLLKLDTQGFDLEVCRGGSQTIARVLALQSELAFRKTYDEMPTYLNALEVFSGLGFELTGLYPLGRDKSDCTIVDADCLFVRTSATGSADSD